MNSIEWDKDDIMTDALTYAAINVSICKGRSRMDHKYEKILKYCNSGLTKIEKLFSSFWLLNEDQFFSFP